MTRLKHYIALRYVNAKRGKIARASVEIDPIKGCKDAERAWVHNVRYIDATSRVKR